MVNGSDVWPISPWMVFLYFFSSYDEIKLIEKEPFYMLKHTQYFVFASDSHSVEVEQWSSLTMCFRIVFLMPCPYCFWKKWSPERGPHIYPGGTKIEAHDLESDRRCELGVQIGKHTGVVVSHTPFLISIISLIILVSCGYFS